MLACVHVTAKVRLVSWCAMRRGCSPSGTVRMCSFCGKTAKGGGCVGEERRTWHSALGVTGKCAAASRLASMVGSRQRKSLTMIASYG